MDKPKENGQLEFENPTYDLTIPVKGIQNEVERDKIKVYKRRWVILLLFSALSGFQSLIWIVWGPIAATSEHAFGWKDSDIAFFVNWGPITFIPMALPVAWLTDRKGEITLIIGLRPTVLTGMFLITLGTGIKCISKDPNVMLWLAHVGQALNGMAGPIAMGAATTVSSVWFPPDQRATATSIMCSSQTLLIAVSFISGPYLVPETFKRINLTDHNHSMFGNATKEIERVVQIERDNIMLYFYIIFGICVVILISMLVYFPNKPHHPPSASATKIRLDYFAGFKQLLKNRQFWLVGVISGSSLGTRDSWSSMLDVNLKVHNVSQTEAGWIGSASTMAAVFSTIVIARFADTYRRKMKLFLLSLFLSTTVIYLWLVLTLMGILQFSLKSVFAAVVLGSLFNGATAPIFYELCCELTYPVAEGITNIVLTLHNCGASLIFLGLFHIHNIGTMWMNYALLAAYSIGSVGLLFLTETHNRLDVDEDKIT